MESKKISLQDIADRAHVSKGLVSKVINNRPVRVSDQKREEILRIAADLDYEPSGQVLKCAPIPTMNKTIGVILPDLRYGFMGLLADTITKIAYENGYSVLMFNSKEDRALEQRYLDLCSTLHVAGIILDSRNSASSTGNLERLTQQSIPIVFVDCYPYNSVHSVVSSRNREYMFKLTESLIQEIRDMNKQLEIPTCIKEYEGGIIDEKEFNDKLKTVAELAVGDACTGSNPRIPTQEEMEKLLLACYYDKEIDF